MDKKKKKKKSSRKIFKGFTLVELLAVIVILAIIMIIAIPAVLNTLESSRKKTMIEFAQKAMDKAEEVYMEKILLGESVLKSADANFLFFNIKEDLGLSNTGDFKGQVYLGIIDDGSIVKGIDLLNNNYFLHFEKWENEKLDETAIITLPDQLKMLYENYSSRLIKESMSYNFLHQKCNDKSIAAVDMSDLSQIFCTNKAKIDSCEENFDKLNEEAGEIFYNNPTNPNFSNCP